MKKRRISLADIQELLGDKVIRILGNTKNVYIDNLADAEHTTATTLDWVNPNKTHKQSIVESSIANVLLVDETIQYSEVIQARNKTLIVVKDPKYALARVGNEFFVPNPEIMIHPTAIIDSEANLGEGVSVGPYSIIGKATIGDNCIISSNVRIYDGVVMGHDCRVREGAILGGEGFGFEKDDQGNWFRFPQIGALKIGDYVEIGPYTCIDKGALSETVIGDYCKMDAHVRIAHNNQVGNNVIFTSYSGLSGSCKIGDNIWFGPGSLVNNWLKIDNDAYICMGSVVLTNVKEGKRVLGYPALKIKL